MTSGIYQITCTVSGKRYVGSSVNIQKRWSHHICRLKQGKHVNPHLQNSWNKYGENAFEFSVVEETDRSSLRTREMAIIQATQPELNLKQPDITRGSWIDSPETTRRKSEANKGRRAWNKGIPMPAITRAALMAVVTGRVMSDETRRKLATAKTGTTLSEEARAKISKAHKGKKRGPMTPERRAKISASNKGRSVSQKTRDAVAASNKRRAEKKVAE